MAGRARKQCDEHVSERNAHVIHDVLLLGGYVTSVICEMAEKMYGKIHDIYPISALYFSNLMPRYCR